MVLVGRRAGRADRCVWQAIGAPVSLITEIAIYTLYGAGVNLLVGYTGLVPFGASVFFGCATYATAIAMRDFLGNEIEALVFAVLFSIVLGAVMGIIILRRRGLYFSLLTLAFSQIAFEIAFKWTDLTGGENGLQGVPRPCSAISRRSTPSRWRPSPAACGCCGGSRTRPSAACCRRCATTSSACRAWATTPSRIKLQAFVIMAAVLGYAGGLLALMLRGAYADNLSWQHAGDALLMTVLGGVHQFLGPLWGAIAFILLEDRLSAVTENWWLLFAPIIIVFALGLAGRAAGSGAAAVPPPPLDAGAARHPAPAGRDRALSSGARSPPTAASRS